ncbi:hypothetical protein [Xanthobacter sp. YC-JY1]|uniref:hypothetical protein n=1 Tax=Xanthobacter sp. YC-JY1 TaxID=2419844 RepID=UPI001F27FAB2|nr:hypothetical protein [Xanthobacter sp. YC-JY1]UJX45743.1 hypothetical protein D7006_14210 [Xanthobacter sp. YC-JY1]
MADTFTDADLFNCCYDGKEPATEELRHYRRLVVGGVRDDTAPEEEGGTYFVPCSDDLAEMWTVYARLSDGEFWAITDAATRERAEAIAKHLSARWHIPMEGEGGA